jgi:hypothetical protein
MDVVNDVIKANTGLLRMYFDGAYQRRKNGKIATANMEKLKQPKQPEEPQEVAAFDWETGEIIEPEDEK